MKDIMDQPELVEMLEKVATYMGTTFFFVFVLTYVLAFRNYHLAVEKHQNLTDLFNNPNARVASGAKAKQILSHVKSSNTLKVQE
jgi:hypothetical protein